MYRRRRGHYVPNHFQLELVTSYQKLVELFGEPEKNPHEKTVYQWDLETVDGKSPVTIYDYYAPYDPALATQYRWSVGAQNMADAQKFFLDWFQPPKPKRIIYRVEVNFVKVEQVMNAENTEWVDNGVKEDLDSSVFDTYDEAEAGRVFFHAEDELSDIEINVTNPANRACEHGRREQCEHC